ncbi:hypothetical protein RF55_16452 [Lasius niger]|uniref:Uncharacterized protein n=1 Tax=Lasius niger TaxID=67767 RepID=A0A0J7K403_LASNI|nr:hypothetical protein RF55_16452 [Lasius niger]
MGDSVRGECEVDGGFELIGPRDKGGRVIVQEFEVEVTCNYGRIVDRAELKQAVPIVEGEGAARISVD